MKKNAETLRKLTETAQAKQEEACFKWAEEYYTDLVWPTVEKAAAKGHSEADHCFGQWSPDRDKIDALLTVITCAGISQEYDEGNRTIYLNW